MRSEGVEHEGRERGEELVAGVEDELGESTEFAMVSTVVGWRGQNASGLQSCSEGVSARARRTTHFSVNSVGCHCKHGLAYVRRESVPCELLEPTFAISQLHAVVLLARK